MAKVYDGGKECKDITNIYMGWSSSIVNQAHTKGQRSAFTRTIQRNVKGLHYELPPPPSRPCRRGLLYTRGQQRIINLIWEKFQLKIAGISLSMQLFSTVFLRPSRACGGQWETNNILVDP